MESNRIIQGTETRLLPVKLTDGERTQYARQLAQEFATYDQIEAEKKDITSRLGKQLKSQRTTLDSLTSRVLNGVEDREVEVEVLFDFQRKMVEITRVDTFEVVEKRPMKKEEIAAHAQTRAQYEEDGEE